MPIEFPKDKFPGSVRTVTLGATAAAGGSRAFTVSVGGEKTLPYLHFESTPPHPAVVAVEIKDSRPGDWSPMLMAAWGDPANEPVSWAKAVEALGVRLLVLALS